MQDTNRPISHKFDVEPPKHTRSIRKNFIAREEPPRAKRHTASKGAYHLRIGRFPLFKNWLNKAFRVELFRVLAKVFWGVVLRVRWKHDVVAYFQSIAGHRSFLHYDTVGRREGV